MGLSKEQVTKINITMGKINDIIKNTLGEDFPICHSYFIADREGIKNLIFGIKKLSNMKPYQC